jgi:hypothetical protein
VLLVDVDVELACVVEVGCAVDVELDVDVEVDVEVVVDVELDVELVVGTSDVVLVVEVEVLVVAGRTQFATVLFNVRWSTSIPPAVFVSLIAEMPPAYVTP